MVVSRLAALGLVLLLLGTASSQPPTDPESLIPCPGCDCRGNGCFVRKHCGCGGPVTDEAAVAMLEYSQKILRLAFGDKLDLEHPVRIQAASPAALAELDGREVYGLYDDAHNLIYVSNGITRADALGIVAHELGHAWMYQHHPNAARTSEVLCEGFAEWVAYQVLTRAGSLTQASLIRRSGDPIYGVGFRWFQALEKEHGVDAVLEVARSWLDIDFPKAPP